jgi:peptidoglycan/xylan/chitin deacetylase (PgdA/CDA1 family)
LGDREKSWVIEDANEGTPFVKGRMIVVPLREENKAGLAPEGYQVVPILCYHHFNETCKTPLCMTVQDFDGQMRYLKENGYRSISLAQLYDFLNYRKAIPKRSVVITIDDGYSSVYDIAYPILKKYGFRATLFLYTDFAGVARSAVTWQQVKEMKDYGFEVGSHTVSHCDLTKKQAAEDGKTYVERIRKELIDSKQIIDRKLNQDTVFFAFPYGSYNQQVIKLCEDAGYMMGVSVKKGSNPFFADPFALKRNQILKGDMDYFVSRLGTFYRMSLR